MIKYFSFLFYLLVALSFSQNKKYFGFINQAELSIVKSDFKKASRFYEQAFEKSSDPFVLDIVNYLKCNCLVENEINLDKITILLERGLTLKHLQKDKLLKKCIKHNNQFDKIKPIYDADYRAKIQKLGYDDQYFRLKKGSYVKYRNEIDSIDKINIDDLLKLIDLNGFPSESRIGVENIVGWQEWMIVVLHYQQQRSRDKSKRDITDVLKKAVSENDLTPNIYAHLAEMQNDSIYRKFYSNPLIKLEKGKFRIFKSTLEKSTSINSEREKIGMSSIKDQIVKTLFIESKKNNHNFFFGHVESYFDLTKQSKELKNHFKKKSVKVSFKEYDFNGK